MRNDGSERGGFHNRTLSLAALALAVMAVVQVLGACQPVANRDVGPSTTRATVEAEPMEAARTKLEAAARLRKEFRLKEAAGLLREAMELYRGVDPELTSVESARCKRLLAQVLTDQGDYAAAESLAAESYLSLRERFPEEQFPVGSEELARSMWLLGSIWLASERTEDAETLLRGALDWFWDTQPSSDETGVLLIEIGDCLSRLAKFSDAESAFRIGYELLRTHRGMDSPETLDALHKLTEFYELRGQPEVAEYYRQQASEPSAQLPKKP